MAAQLASLDLGTLLLRASIGAMLVVHGGNKVFGAGGLAGTTRWFEELGMHPAWLHARIAATTEITAGTALAAGFLSTLDCAAVIGLMVVAAATDHRGKGFFVFKGGWEYVALVGVAAAALACTGPGRWSLDHAFGVSRFGAGWAAAAVALGVVSATATIAVSRLARPTNVAPAEPAGDRGAT